MGYEGNRKSFGVPHRIHKFSTEKGPVAYRFPHGTSHYKAFHPESTPLPFPLPEVPQEREVPGIPAPQAMDWPAAVAPQAGKQPAVLPLKLGVTALCRALDGAQTLAQAAEEEEQQLKRLPYEGPRPRLLSSLPAMPAFLEPPKEEEGLLRGVQTHRLLGLMDLQGARAAKGDEKALSSI